MGREPQLDGSPSSSSSTLANEAGLVGGMSLSAPRGSADARRPSSDKVKHDVDSFLQDEDDPDQSAFINQQRFELDDDNGDAKQLPPVSSSEERRRFMLFYWIVAASTLAANLAPRIATKRRTLVWNAALLENALIATAAWLYNRAQSKRHRFHSPTTTSPDRSALNARFATAACVVLSSWLALWQARWLDARVWQAIETMPVALLLAMSTTAWFPKVSRINDSNWIVLASSVSAVIFCLVGLPANARGLGIALLKPPVDAVKFCLLKTLADSDPRASFTVSVTYGVATFIAFVPAIIDFFVFRSAESVSYSSAPLHHPAVSIMTYAICSALSTGLLLFAFSTFKSCTTPLTSVFHRNMIQLVAYAVGRGALPLRGHWTQMALVLAVSSVSTFLSDDELRPLIAKQSQVSSDHGYRSNGYHHHHHSHHAAGFSSIPAKRKTLIALLPCLPLIAFVASTPSTAVALVNACDYLPSRFRSQVCHNPRGATVSRTVDLVFAYYDEPLPRFKNHLDAVRRLEFVWRRRNTVYVYNKGPRSESEIRQGLDLEPYDVVIPLDNLGREGATYLEHIVRRYNATMQLVMSSSTPVLSSSQSSSSEVVVDALDDESLFLADHTFFMQPHLAWDWIARPRLELVDADTGFAHFGPLIKNECGTDTRVGHYFQLVRDMWSIFTDEICSPEGQLTAWSAQFAVSKKRILENPYSRYSKMLDLMLKPQNHWIHRYWGPNGSGAPDNPAIGHALERAWPFVFGCKDPKLVDECPDTVADKEKCQCLDS